MPDTVLSFRCWPAGATNLVWNNVFSAATVFSACESADEMQ